MEWFGVAQNFTSCLGDNTTILAASQATTTLSVHDALPVQPWFGPSSDAKQIFGPYSAFIAVGVVVLAAVLSGLGAFVQKAAHKYSTANHFCPRPLTGKKLFLVVVGVTCIVLAAALDLAALMFGNISLVAPLGALKLVVNVLFGGICDRRHRILPMEWLWLICVVAGCVVVVFFSVPKTCIFTLDDLQQLFLRVPVISYASAVGFLIIVALICVCCIRQTEKRHGTDSLRYKRVATLDRNTYPVAAGMIGAQSVLFGKALVEGVTDYVVQPPGAPPPDWTVGVWVAMSAGEVAFVALQIYLLNTGLKRWPPHTQLPVFQCTWTVWSVVGGAVFYQEMRAFQLLDWIIYPAGVLLVLVGFVMLQIRRGQRRERSESSNEVNTTAVKLLEGYGE